MRSLILGSIGAVVVIGVASLALRIDASIAVDEYVRPDAPHVMFTGLYDEGVYSFDGSVRVPTRCTGVTATPTITEESTLRVDITIEEDVESCLMLSTLKEFSGEFEVEDERAAAVYVNGIKAVIVETL